MITEKHSTCITMFGLSSWLCVKNGMYHSLANPSLIGSTNEGDDRLAPQRSSFLLLYYLLFQSVNIESRDGKAEGLGRLTERVPNVRPNFGRMLCARMKQRLLLVSALSGQKMS